MLQRRPGVQPARARRVVGRQDRRAAGLGTVPALGRSRQGSLAGSGRAVLNAIGASCLRHTVPPSCCCADPWGEVAAWRAGRLDRSARTLGRAPRPPAYLAGGSRTVTARTAGCIIGSTTSGIGMHRPPPPAGEHRIRRGASRRSPSRTPFLSVRLDSCAEVPPTSLANAIQVPAGDQTGIEPALCVDRDVVARLLEPLVQIRVCSHGCSCLGSMPRTSRMVLRPRITCTRTVAGESPSTLAAPAASMSA